MKFLISEDKIKFILKESTKEEYNQLKLYINNYEKDFRFKTRWKLTRNSTKPWDGKYDAFHDGFMDLGLWQTCYKCCKEYGYPFEIINKQNLPINKEITKEQISEFCKDFYKDHKDRDDLTKPFIPYEHQEESIFRVLKHQFGRVEVATAGGKSLIFGSMIFYWLRKINPDSKFLLIVPTMDLVTQFYNDINDYNLGFHNENKNPISNIRMDEIMSDHPRKYHGEEPNIYIGTYHSLVKYPIEFFHKFDVVCCDEGHRAKGYSLKKILRNTFGHAKIRFAMSGTFPNDDTGELRMIEEVTGPLIFNIKAKKLMELGIITPCKIKGIILNHNQFSFASNVYNIKRNGNGRKAWELEKKFAQNSLPRKMFIGKLVNKFTNNSLILFQNIDYGKELYNYLRDNIQGKDFYYIDGHTPKEKRAFIKKQMEDTSGNIKVGVFSFGTSAVGISIKAVVNLVFADSFKSDQIVTQAIGRVLRLHSTKTNAIIFDLVDQFHHDFKGVLYGHFQFRKKEVYEKRDYYYEELKFLI
jgi:superfamily II DNA or RNA helicase